MKKTCLSIPSYFLVIFIVITLIFLSTAFAPSAFAQQAENPPPPENPDIEVGSTTGITILSFIIVAAILLPILTNSAFWRKKNPPQK